MDPTEKSLTNKENTDNENRKKRNHKPRVRTSIRRQAQKAQEEGVMTNKKWTKEELAGRILVTCRACWDGLEPFIDKKMPFETMAEADHFFQEKFFTNTDNQGIMLRWSSGSDRCALYDIHYYATVERCGGMVIEVCEVVD